MKKTNRLLLILLVFTAAVISGGCSVMNDVDDQSPKLIVDVDVSGLAGPIDAQHPICLVYYNKSDFTQPWLQQCSVSASLLNPVVINLNTYLVVFWDKNGNGVLDTNDPYCGYDNVFKPGPLIIVPFLPLQITKLNMTLADVPGKIW